MIGSRPLLFAVLSSACLVACGSSSGGEASDAASQPDGRADAPRADARQGDARLGDARRGDAALSDAASSDASVPDSASTDAGADAADAGPAAEAGPDGASDASSVDGSPRDAEEEGSADAALEGGDGGSCHGTSGAADGPRKIVVSHPYGATSGDAGLAPASTDFEVFDLDSSGNITEPNVHFQLGTTTNGFIAFTPDGAVGIVAEDDGTLGVFRFDAVGAPHVVSASLAGNYYATGVVMDPSGARAYILDEQTANNGGGIYSVSIDCDGTLHDEGLLATADLPAAIVPVAGGDAVIAAKTLLGVPAAVDAGPDAAAHAGNDAVLVPWPSATKVVGTANPFRDDQAIVSSAALTQDGRYVLLGDNSGFSTVPNRIGVVEVGSQTIQAAGVVPNVNDPETLVASPFDDTVLVTSAFDNALYLLRPSVDAGAVPFAFAGHVTYVGATPQLPGIAVMIRRGTLEGRVLVAEVQAVRQVQFAMGGVVTDLGPTATGDAASYASIVGALGVQP